MKITIKALIVSILTIAIGTTALAYTGDISVNSKHISFSKTNFLEGQKTRIYVTTANHSDLDLLGVVRFFDNDKQVGGDQNISIFKKATDGVFVDWTPTYGKHKITVKIFPWNPEIDDPNNNSITTDIYVVQDTDRDGIPNKTDKDDDNDGVIDTEDAFPLNSKEQYDTDGDGQGNNADKDDDNDDVPDEYDDLPLDPNESVDTDHDGIGDINDHDDDNDKLTDTEEENLKTNPLKADTDDDGYDDYHDAFPLNSDEWLDTDGDKIGNNKDPDDDNDGIKDTEDKFPLNKAPQIKLREIPKNITLFKKQLFDASPSYDEDGKIKSYTWEIDGKNQKEGNAVNLAFNKTGKHKVKVTIIDNTGQKTNEMLEVNVVNTNLYIQLAITLFAILLALTIFFKYIAEAKN